MKERFKNLTTPLAVLVIVGIAVLGGLFIPRLFAQEVLPQLGMGSLHKVEIFNTDKCSASIIAFTSSNESAQVNIVVPRGRECAQAVGAMLASDATIVLQNLIDICQPISSLPDDDPDKTEDPRTGDADLKSMFYKGSDLCSRSVTVEITWDGNEYDLAWKSTNTGRK